jgi:hypothetical protein
MSNNVKGYCEVCGREYSNIHQHYKTKKHANAVAAIESEENSIENNENIITPETIDNIPIEEIKNDDDDDIGNKQHNAIQIIDSNTSKQQKSSIQEIMDIAFSEQFAPITMSILDGLVKRVTNQHNPEQEDGKYVISVSGAKIPILNENF